MQHCLAIFDCGPKNHSKFFFHCVVKLCSLHIKQENRAFSKKKKKEKERERERERDKLEFLRQDFFLLFIF